MFTNILKNFLGQIVLHVYPLHQMQKGDMIKGSLKSLKKFARHCSILENGET